MKEQTGLKAGAGKAEIYLPDSYFPATENFVGLHDPLHVRALYLENGGRILIVSIEITSLMGDYVDEFRTLAAETAGLDYKEVWILVTHTFSTPHLTSREKRKQMTSAEQESLDVFDNALREALVSAVEQAMGNIQPVTLGVGMCTCGVNINRDIQTSEGWWLGRSEAGASDRRIHVLRFDDMNGDPVAILFHYGIQSSASQNAKLKVGGYLVSGDIVGVATLYLEAEYGVPALFLLGACGDQTPILSSCYNEVSKDGEIRVRELGEQGYMLMEELGRHLGSVVSHIVSGVVCHYMDDDLRVYSDSVTCVAQEMVSNTQLHPSKQYEFTLDGEKEATIDLITLGDIVIVGTQAELSATTSLVFSSQSPYPCTLVCSMVNGGAKYMARKESYQMITYEAMNSPFASGSAERWEEKTLDILSEIRKENKEVITQNT